MNTAYFTYPDNKMVNASQPGLMWTPASPASHQGLNMEALLLSQGFINNRFLNTSWGIAASNTESNT